MPRSQLLNHPDPQSSDDGCTQATVCLISMIFYFLPESETGQPRPQHHIVPHHQTYRHRAWAFCVQVLQFVSRQGHPRNDFHLPTFPAAVLFLSIATTSDADRAAGGEPIRIGVQRSTGHQEALNRGIGVVKEFVEIGTPATSLRRRPVLRRLLAYLQNHPDIHYVIFPAPHRFAHTDEHAYLLRNHFRRLDVRILIAEAESRVLREIQV
ncbi:recombinase family protein [Nocardia takedensis]